MNEKIYYMHFDDFYHLRFAHYSFFIFHIKIYDLNTMEPLLL